MHGLIRLITPVSAGTQKAVRFPCRGRQRSAAAGLGARECPGHCGAFSRSHGSTCSRALGREGATGWHRQSRDTPGAKFWLFQVTRSGTRAPGRSAGCLVVEAGLRFPSPAPASGSPRLASEQPCCLVGSRLCRERVLRSCGRACPSGDGACIPRAAQTRVPRAGCVREHPSGTPAACIPLGDRVCTHPSGTPGTCATAGAAPCPRACAVPPQASAFG